jgi:acetyl esterase/lipase
MRLTLVILLLLPSFILGQRVSPADLLKEEVRAADHRLSYGTGELQFGELRLPDSKGAKGPHPVVMLVHGGCWADRLKGLDPRATTMELLRPMAAALAASGIATWNVEYRRNGNPGGGWPGSFEDLSLATDYLRGLAATHNLDLTRVVVAGHSSGGHLAMWIAARPKLPPTSPVYTKNPLRVKGVINLDGPADPATVQPLETKVCGLPAVTEFLGGTPAEQPDRYRDASPQPFLPLGVAQEFIAGGLGQNMMDQIKEYESAARAKGDTVTITTLPGAGHFDMLSPSSTHWKTVEDRIRAILHLVAKHY